MMLTLSAAGCAPQPPDDAWVLEPISYHNSLDGEARTNVIDVTYPMDLVSDTNGGFWGISSDSWLHIDGSGSAVSRFNHFRSYAVGPAAAVTPTEIALVGLYWPAISSGEYIILFDTETKTDRELHADNRMIGDIAVFDGYVYFVAFTPREATFTIEKIPIDSNVDPIEVVPKMEGTAPVALDLDSEGDIYVATANERVVIAADGVVRSRESVPAERPAVSVTADGTVAWSGKATSDAEVSSFIAGGTNEARQLIDEHDCAASALSENADRLTLESATGRTTLPFLCNLNGFVWIGDREFVVSVGTEGGAPLIRVSPPAATGG